MASPTETNRRSIGEEGFLSPGGTAVHDCQLERLFYAAKQEPGTYSIYECAPNADLWTTE
jgi:hypothetical protein